MSEQNLCTISQLKTFDTLPTEKKFVFVSEDRGISSQIIFKDYLGTGFIPNDTTHFRKYINIIHWLNDEPYKLHQ